MFRRTSASESTAAAPHDDARTSRRDALIAQEASRLHRLEQSLERLRRWHRTIKSRDIFGAPSSGEADHQLKHCQERLADYTERVFAALHRT